MPLRLIIARVFFRAVNFECLYVAFYNITHNRINKEGCFCSPLLVYPEYGRYAFSMIMPH